jgi:adenylate kinase family enzyme
MNVLFTGAAGSGQSTIGRIVAERLGATFQEADSIYWLPSDPAFTAKRDSKSRLRLMHSALNRSRDVVVAGSVMNWGRNVEDAFEVIFFLYAPTSIRVDRLRRREFQRYGTINAEFLDWASQYDEGRLPGRSLQRHERWLAQRTCRVVRLDAARPIDYVTEKALSIVGDTQRSNASR